MAAAHCASTSSAFLGLPRGNGRRRNSCRFVANARLVPVSATLDKETAAAKPRRSRNRRSRKATKSESTALLAAAEPAEAKNGGGGGRGMVALDDVIVNPVGLGRRSRQVFDEVWRKFSRLGQMSSASSSAVAEQDPAVLFRGGPMCEFTVPGAQDITVLVVGATSRIGRIVVRKLMLRGYNVKVFHSLPLCSCSSSVTQLRCCFLWNLHVLICSYAILQQTLVRRNDPEVIDMLPRSVDIVVGDVGDPSSVQAAVSGCNKVIYCATARSTITGDLNRVDNQGVRNVTKAFQVLDKISYD